MSSFNARDLGFVVYSRFEPILRGLVCDGLRSCCDEPADKIPTNIKEKVLQRAKGRPMSDIEDYLEFSDLPDLVDLINQFKPPQFAIIYRDKQTSHRFTEISNQVYNLRCKIAHARDIFSDYELSALKSGCIEMLAATPEAQREFTERLNQIKADQGNPLTIGQHIYLEEGGRLKAISNNLPIPDYADDGGFIGRTEEVSRIIELLKKHNVVTLAGAGGVGKTALCQQVIHEIAERGALQLDCIVWSSAKENRLSYLGIEEFEPDIKNLEDLLQRIASVVGLDFAPEASLDQKEANIRHLAEKFSYILIALDNLETLDDANITNFIFDAPPNFKFLITSRKGLGQVERRYEVQSLRPRDAVHLFRTVCRSRKVEFMARLDDSLLTSYVEKLNCYPLIIKWAIGHVAMGRSIEEVFTRASTADDDIARFCFDFIYQGLSTPAKKVLAAVCVLDEQSTPGVLKYVSNLEETSFTDAIQELLLVSLLIQEGQKTTNGKFVRKFSVLSLTRAYVRRVLHNDMQIRSEIDERWRSVRVSITDAEKAKSVLKFSLLSSGAETEEEKIAVVLANTALQKVQGGLINEGVALFQRALEIAPHFYAIYRSWALAESGLGHYSEADDLMQKAVDANPKDFNNWLTWSNIKRRAGHTRDALKYCQEAHTISPKDRVVLSTLGQCHALEHQFERAAELIEQSLSAQDGTVVEDYHKKINHTALASVYLEWGFSLSCEKQSSAALKKLECAVEMLDQLWEQDRDDIYIIGLRLRALNMLAGHICTGNPTRAITLLSEALEMEPKKYTHIVSYVRSSLLLAGIFHYLTHINEAKAILDTRTVRKAKLTNKEAPLAVKTSEFRDALNKIELWKRGHISRIDDNTRYIIVIPAEIDTTVLIPISAFILPFKFNEGDWLDRTVSYFELSTPYSDGRNRYIATLGDRYDQV